MTCTIGCWPIFAGTIATLKCLHRANACTHEQSITRLTWRLIFVVFCCRCTAGRLMDHLHSHSCNTDTR